MYDVRIIDVDADIAVRTAMHEGTRMVQLQVPTDRPVKIHAKANAKRTQRLQVFDGDGHIHFHWERRGQEVALGSGSRTFSVPTLLVGCSALLSDEWIVSDMNVNQSEDESSIHVQIRCEDGGDFPGDWNDLVVDLEWSK